MFILVTPQRKVYTDGTPRWESQGGVMLLNVAHIIAVCPGRNMASVHLSDGTLYEVLLADVEILPRIGGTK